MGFLAFATACSHSPNTEIAETALKPSEVEKRFEVDEQFLQKSQRANSIQNQRKSPRQSFYNP